MVLDMYRHILSKCENTFGHKILFKLYTNTYITHLDTIDIISTPHIFYTWITRMQSFQ